MNSDSFYLPDASSNSVDIGSASDTKRWPGSLKRQPRWMKYSLLGALGLMVLAGGTVGYQYVVSVPADTVPAQNAALPVETVAVEEVSSYQVPRIYTGEIAALRRSQLGFERGGELVQVLADEGQRVQTGEPIARLDTRNLETQRLQVEAQKAQAIARLTELQNGARAEDIAAAEAGVRDLEQQLVLQETQERRREFLYERGAISREQLDEFTYGSNSLQARLDQARNRLAELRNGTRFEQVDAQEAAVEQLEAQLKDIDVNISKSVITAPFDGIVAERNADEGTVVGTGQAVLELVEAAVPEVRIGVPANVIDQMQIGDVQTVRVDNQPFFADVAAILPQVEASTRTQTVVLTIETAAVGEIEPGQTAELTIDETIQADGFWLPRGALTQGIRGLWTCYVVVSAADYQDTESPDSASESSTAADSDQNATGTDSSLVVEQRSVEIIQQETTDENAEETTRVLVRGTLEPGDRVVTSGAHRLVPEQAVTLISAR